MNAGERTITIPAGGTHTERVPSQKTFFCIATDGVYSVRPGNSEENVIRQVADTFEERTAFGKLTFRNRTGAPVTTTVWIGEERFSSQNVSVSVPSGVSVTNIPSVSVQNTLANCVDSNPSQFLKTSTAAAAAVALAAAGTKFRWALLLGCKSENGTANVGSVFVGASGDAGKQPIEIFPGSAYVLPLPQGAKWDFGSWFLKVANDGDGLVVIFT